jgi:hypothetical protein
MGKNDIFGQAHQQQKKNEASARPTKVYWIGWIGSDFKISNRTGHGFFLSRQPWHARFPQCLASADGKFFRERDVRLCC